MVEDAFNISLDEKRVNQSSAQKVVGHVVDDFGLIPHRFNTMFVDPASVGPLDLSIYKSMGRFPRGDFAYPAKGYSSKAQCVFNLGTGVHINRCWRQDTKVQEARRQVIEIVRI